MDAADYVFSSRAWVDNYLRSNLGYPVLELIEKEKSESMDLAVKNALVVYWTAVPYNFPIEYESSIEEGPLLVTEDSVLLRALGADAASQRAVVLGPIRMDDVPFPALNRQLVGRYGHDVYGGGTTYGRPGLTDYWHGRPLNLEKELLNATEHDLVTGEISFEYDNVRRLYTFETPNAITRFTVWWAMGFFSDLNLTKLKESHIVFFSKLVLYEYLNIIVKARSSVEISSDITINYSALESQMSDLRSELQEQIQKYTLIPAVFS